jgi:hypothetical protein
LNRMQGLKSGSQAPPSGDIRLQPCQNCNKHTAEKLNAQTALREEQKKHADMCKTIERLQKVRRLAVRHSIQLAAGSQRQGAVEKFM